MMMPGRKYTVADGYRYGFNGQENEKELNENITSAEFWMYDSRIARRWEKDPIVKPFESPYLVFSGNPIYFMDSKGLDSDPPGDDEPTHKKPGFFKRIWRAFTGDYHTLRAEDYCAQLNKCASQIQTIDMDKDTRIVIARFDFIEVTEDANGDPLVTITSSYKYSIFRESKGSLFIGGGIRGAANDDRNLTEDEFIQNYVPSETIIDYGGFGGGTKKGLTLLAQGGSKLFAVQQGAKMLQNWRKFIRMGVNDADVLNKGFHLHFEDGLELGLKTMADGKIGLQLVGKKTFTLLQVQNAVSVFNNAMRSDMFRKELLVRLVDTQKYLQQAFKSSKNIQQAIDKSHELNYLIQSLKKSL
jgi:hypothetical protein